MNRKLLLISLVLITLLAAGQATAFSFSKGKEGSGKMETRELSLDEFRAIEVGGAFDLEISFGDHPRIEATIDDNLWDIFEAKVKGEWLNLDWKKSCRPSGDCRVKLVVRNLEEIQIHGAADVDISGFKGPEFTYRLSGAGDLEMAGEVDNLDIRISGAGDVDTRDLIAKNVKVNISGAGNARVHAADSIRGRVSGVGNLTFFGDPDDDDTRVSGLGKIRRK